MVGGESTTIRRMRDKPGEKRTTIHDRVVTDDRKKAIVIVTDYMRRVRKNRLVKTPFGSIFPPDAGQFLKDLMASASKSVATYNVTSQTCKIWNCMVWEVLADKRFECLTLWYKSNAHSKKANAILRSIIHLSGNGL